MVILFESYIMIQLERHLNSANLHQCPNSVKGDIKAINRHTAVKHNA